MINSPREKEREIEVGKAVRQAKNAAYDARCAIARLLEVLNRDEVLIETVKSLPQKRRANHG